MHLITSAWADHVIAPLNEKPAYKRGVVGPKIQNGGRKSLTRAWLREHGEGATTCFFGQRTHNHTNKS